MKISTPFIVFETSDKCNLNCKYCYNYFKSNENYATKKIDSKLARKTFKRIISNLKISQIAFSGGEPFLLSNLEDLVLKARFRNITTSIITNGYRIEGNRLRNLIKINNGFFQLPLHSSYSKVHNSLVNIDDGFQESVRTIKFLVQNGCKVAAVLVATKLNYHDVYKTLGFINSLGIKRVMLNRYNIGGTSMNNCSELILSKFQLEETFLNANIAANDFNLKISSNISTPFCILNPLMYKNIVFSRCSNRVEQLPITINYRGDVRICNHSPTILGNIYRTNVSNILNKESIRNWASNIPDDCIECKDIEQCKGGCRAAAEQYYGTSLKADPYLDLV